MCTHQGMANAIAELASMAPHKKEHLHSLLKTPVEADL